MVCAQSGHDTFLHPGDVAMGLRGDTLQTLLGSCIAIILTDPRRTVGVMCHIVHVSPAMAGDENPCTHAGAALQRMHQILLKQGINAGMCEAYVYGGGNMFPKLVNGPSVGDSNAHWALDALHDMGVRVLSVDVGGPVYRQLSWTVGMQAPRAVAVHL
jgi:chemotaxis protein CheD